MSVITKDIVINVSDKQHWTEHQMCDTRFLCDGETLKKIYLCSTNKCIVFWGFFVTGKI